MRQLSKEVSLLALSLCISAMSMAQDVTFKVTHSYNNAGVDQLTTGYMGAQAMDGDLATAWQVGEKSGDNWIVIEASEPITLTGYTIVTAADVETTGYKPSEWEIYGSNTKSDVSYDSENSEMNTDDWEHVARVRNDSRIQLSNSTYYYFTNNVGTKLYKYYALKIVNAPMAIAEFVPSYLTKLKEGGLTFISGPDADGTEGASKVFDGNVSSKICNENSKISREFHFLFQATTPTALTKYSFCSANDASERNPRAWKIYGLNDSDQEGVAYTEPVLLAEMTDANDTYPTAYKTKVEYTVDNASTTTYKYFKLEITALRGNNTEGLCQFSEFAIDGAGDLTVVEGIDPDGDEGAKKCVDGSVDTKFCHNGGNRIPTEPWVIVFGTDEAVVPTGYTFVTGNDSNNRDPKKWSLYAMNANSQPSADDEGWTLIDQKWVLSSDFTTDRGAEQHFDIASEVEEAYQYYKLVFYDVRDNSGEAKLQFAEFKLDGVSGAQSMALTVANCIGGVTTGNEGVTKAFDGNPDTKWGYYDSTSGFVVIAAKEPIAINGYQILTASNNNGNDVDNEYARIPNVIKVYGSNTTTEEAGDWTLLDEYSDIVASLPSAPWYTMIYRTFDTTTAAYAYYKLEFTSIGTYNESTQNAFQMSELALMYNNSEKASEVKLTDKKDHTFMGNFTAAKVDYSREITGNWGTVCLPYELKSNDDVTFYTLASVQEDYVELAEAATVAANTPAVFYAKQTGTLDLSAENAEILATPSKQVYATDVEGWSLIKGQNVYDTEAKAMTSKALTPTEAGGELYYVGTDNKYHQATESLTVAPERAAFVVTTTDAAKEYRFGVGSDVTEINAIETSKQANGLLYDLQGRKVSSPQKGQIYILDGMKVMFK